MNILLNILQTLHLSANLTECLAFLLSTYSIIQYSSVSAWIREYIHANAQWKKKSLKINEKLLFIYTRSARFSCTCTIYTAVYSVRSPFNLCMLCLWYCVYDTWRQVHTLFMHPPTYQCTLHICRVRLGRYIVVCVHNIIIHKHLPRA